MKKRKICIFTGTRAEYGLLKPLIDELKVEKSVKLQLIISGMHLSPEFGLTYKEIDTDGFTNVEKVEMLLSSDSPIGISKSMGLGMISYSEVLNKLKPDLLIGLGDRYELFSVVSAAMIARIPVAHLHGGEATEGLIDQAIRHSVTKMSHIHFAATEVFRKRIIQLGEDPSSVFNVGAIGVDNIKKIKLLSKIELEEELDFRFSDKTILVTFHPVTLENATAEEQFRNLLKALDGNKELRIIFTKPNSDTDGRIIIKMIDNFVNVNSDRSKAFISLGQLKYLSSLKFIIGVVGNSSSGLIEVPSFKKGSINIGDRQRGRIKANSVIDCGNSVDEIEVALQKLLSKEFQKGLSYVKNPYESKDGFTSEKIKKIITTIDLNQILKKKFYNISFN